MPFENKRRGGLIKRLGLKAHASNRDSPRQSPPSDETRLFQADFASTFSSYAVSVFHILYAADNLPQMTNVQADFASAFSRYAVPVLHIPHAVDSMARATTFFAMPGALFGFFGSSSFSTIAL